MAGKKIGLVLALDGEREFTQAVRNAQKSAKMFDTELKGLSQQFEGNANSMDYLRKRQEILTKQQDAYQKKVDAAKTGLEHANDTYRKQGERLEELKRKLEEARQAQKKMEDAGETGSDAYKKQTKQVNELAEAVDKQNINHLKAAGRVTDWNEKISKSESELRKTNSELQKNEKYLKEAEAATDQCATSIDKFGKETEDATESVKEMGVGLGTMIKAKAVDLAGDALRTLGQKAIEAGEYVVEVGSSFESAMSEVEAFSGASGKDLDLMTKKAKSLGQNTKFSATEVANAFKYMSLAGWSTSDMISGIDGVLNLAAASGMELAEASDMLTDYLSAFGMQASQSAYMADILAYAQANSNTSAEQLGEAYQNCAANMNSAGQDIETTTSLLEAMANQGTKGTKAGTQLSAIMRDITANMENGSIAIGDTNVAVSDSEGNFRDLTDILSDVEKATKGMGDADKNAALQATFTSDSIKGLNLILNEGMDNISGYEDALRNSDGAAQNMANTMQNNLSGKLTTLNSAVEGLGIAAFDYVSGPLSGAAEGVTDVINSITDAITPQKTELETFIEEIKTSNDEVSKMLENAGNVMSSAEVDVSGLEAYKQTLISLNDVEEKDEFQKYQIKNAVDALSESIPQLAEAYDSETGSIKLTNDEIERLIDNQEELIMQQAMESAKKEYLEAYAQSKIEEAKATAAQKQAQEDYNKALEDYNSKLEEYAANGMDTSGLDAELSKFSSNLIDANNELEQAQDNTAAAKKNIDELDDALKELSDSQEKNSAQTEVDVQRQEQLAARRGEAADAAKQNTDAIDGETDALKKNEEAAKAGASAQKEAYQSMMDTYNSTVEAIKSDIQDKINPFEKFSGGTDMTVEDMLSNLQSQTDAMDTYVENMQAVTDAMGDDIAPEFLQYIRDMGMDGANMLQHMADTLNQENGKELLKQLSDEYVEGLDKSEEIAKAQAANEMALKASMGELGSSESDFQGLRDNISSAISDAIGDTDSAWNGISDNTQKALNDAVAIAQECGAQIPEGLAEGITSGEVSPEEAIAQLNGSVEGSLNGLLDAAKESGIDIPEEVAAGISAGGQSAVDAYNELISLLSAAKADAEAAGEEGGTAVANSYASGMESGAENASSAGSALSESAATSAGKNKSDFSTAGKTAASQYASGIKGSTSTAVQAAGSMASRSAAAVRSWQGSFYSAGYSMASGVASGISAGQSQAISAASRMAREALQAAKKELEINSPSKKFKQDVGKQIASGMAFGIRDNASLAGREASRMSNTVYTRAVSWMQNYKQDHKTSLDDEIYYWQQVLKHVKKGTSAYNRAMGNLNRVMGYQVGSRDLAQQINSNFGVSRTQRNGNRTTTLSDADYYGEVYSAASQYLRNYQLLNDMSLQQQQAYWRNVRNNLKQGTQAWYDATSQINDLQEQIEQAQQDRLTTRANVQQSILDRYKVYYRVSANAERQYWEAARHQFQEGTDERIEADRRYFEAQQEYYDQRRELDENYAEDSQRINDQLIEDVEELQEAYKDAVKSRKEDILSQMDLFEAWDSSGYDGDTLLYNLRTQVAGLALWEQQLNELSNKPISSALLDELREMGPDAAASIYSLNQMTAEQLAEYNRLWEQRNALAESQAVSENEQLRQETNQQIAQLRSDARAELNALNAEYRSALAELNTGMGTELRNLVNQAATAGEDAVSELIAGIGRAANSVETYQSTTQVTNQLTSQLSHLAQEGRTIGTNTLNGILNGLTDYTKIENTSRAVIQSIKRAMEEEADIHSPSKLFEKAIGQQVPAGVAIGMEGSTKDAVKSAKEMMQDTLAAAQEEMRKQHDALQSQTALLDYSGLNRLNRLMETPIQQNTVVNVDNGGLMSLLGTLVAAVNGLSEKMDNQQVVMDTGVLVGAIQPAMSQESAAVTVRRNRGRLR